MRIQGRLMGHLPDGTPVMVPVREPDPCLLPDPHAPEPSLTSGELVGAVQEVFCAAPCARCGGSKWLYTPPGPASYAGRYDACPDCNTPIALPDSRPLYPDITPATWLRDLLVTLRDQDWADTQDDPEAARTAINEAEKLLLPSPVAALLNESAERQVDRLIAQVTVLDAALRGLLEWERHDCGRLGCEDGCPWANAREALEPGQ